MSGGSYNYLCTRVQPLDEQRCDLENMARRLEGLEWAGAAAAETRRVIRLLDEANAAADRLAGAWRAIEWWDSCDWGEDHARRDVEAFVAPPDVVRDGPDPEVLYRLVHVGEGRYELRAIREGKLGRP